MWNSTKPSSTTPDSAMAHFLPTSERYSSIRKGARRGVRLRSLVAVTVLRPSLSSLLPNPETETNHVGPRPVNAKFVNPHLTLRPHLCENHKIVITRVREEDLVIEKLVEVLQIDDLSWQDLANCRGADADLFFPERGASTRQAKAICRECSVRTECLEFAITTGEKFGIWGGLSERERRKIRRQRAITARRRQVG